MRKKGMEYVCTFHTFYIKSDIFDCQKGRGKTIQKLCQNKIMIQNTCEKAFYVLHL